MLEVIEKGRPSNEHSVPLLFVHGGLHAAWCWDEHFLDYFAGHGFHAIALSWRGHGASLEIKPLARCSINDYIDDVRSVAEGLKVSPVLVGHSVGGFVVQKHLERHPAPAAVLIVGASDRHIALIDADMASASLDSDAREHGWAVV